MSDVDPEIPPWLTEAILSDGPRPADLDVVKQAMTWRTIDAELMELTFDSVNDLAGVRDGGDFRTLEFSTATHTVLVEVSAATVQGRVTPPIPDATVELRRVDDQTAASQSPGDDGSFTFTAVPAGAAHLHITSATTTVTTGTFTVS